MTSVDRYAVIGNPIAQSKSPLIHAAFARATGQTLDYTRLLAPLEGFRATVDAFRAEGGRGLNVTAPFKLQAFEIATDPMDSARQAGAVNALKFDGDRLWAQNFDGVGLVNDIQRNLGVAIAGKRVLLLGAGGATRGALVPFLAQKPAALVVANRTVAKAEGLAREFAAHGRVQAAGYGDLAGERFDVVLNATSASLTAELPPVPASVFAPGALAYELVYGKGLTPFLKLAQASGAASVADGVGMLVEQAAEAFEWWRGVRPATEAVIREMTVPLV